MTERRASGASQGPLGPEEGSDPGANSVTERSDPGATVGTEDGGAGEQVEPVAGARGYPQHWEADVLLADGGVVTLRPTRPDDGPGIVEMHRRMSERSRYLRYFTAVTELTPSQLKIFTGVDHHDSIGLVAVDSGRIVAAATCHRDPRHPAEAEVAFVVEDSQQGRGLGSILLEHLAAAAAESGISRFTAEVLAENQQMLRVFIDAGYAVRREFDSGVVDLHFDIEPTEKSRAVSISREQRAESRSIARLLQPRSVAVIGAPPIRPSWVTRCC